MTSLQRIIKYCAVAFAIFLIVTIIGGICGAIGMLSGFFGGWVSGENAAGEMRTYAVSGSVENLDLEIGAAALDIVTGDRFSLESNHKYLSVKEENHTLKISEEKISFGASYEGVTVVLTVPEGFVFEDASIETDAGKVDIQTLSANTLSLDLGAGKTEIGTLIAQTRAKINTGAGKLTILGGQLNDLTLDHGVGKLELTGLLTGQCEVDFGVGDADLTLLGSREDYQIKLDKGLGNATLDGESMNDGSTYGGGENRIKIDGGVGSIQIMYKDHV